MNELNESHVSVLKNISRVLEYEYCGSIISKDCCKDCSLRRPNTYGNFYCDIDKYKHVVAIISEYVESGGENE